MGWDFVSRVRRRHARAVSAGLLLALSGCAPAEPPVSKAMLVQRGDELAAAGNLTEAAATYRQAVGVDPRDGVVRVKLSQALLAMEDYAAGSIEAIRAADLIPGDRGVELTAIQGMLSLQRFTDAASRAEILVQRNPTDIGALVLLANARAHLISSTFAIFMIENALRDGRPASVARQELRPQTLREDDRAAEAFLRRAQAAAPDAVEPRVALANLLLAGGHDADAVTRLEAIVREGKGEPRLKRSLGVLLLAQGRQEDAERFLLTAIQAGDVGARRPLAEYYASTKRIDEAIRVLEGLGAEHDHDGSAALRMAVLEFSIGRHDRAAERVARLLAQDPANVGALGLQAQILFARRDYVQASRAAAEALKGESTSIEVRLVLARSLAAMGQPARAFDEFSEVWRRGAGDADVAADLAEVALELGRVTVALEFARQGNRLKPGDRRMTEVMAEGFTRSGQLVAASQALSSLLAGAAPSAHVMILQGDLQVARGVSDAARASYRRALELEPESLRALRGLVSVEIAAGRVSQVVPRVTAAADAHPRSADHLALAGWALLDAGDLGRAETKLRSALDIDRDHEESAVFLADLLTRRGRRDDAVRLVEGILDRRPSVRLYAWLAARFETEGRYAEAIRRYEQLLALDSEAHDAAGRLAAIYADRGGNLDQALTLASRAKQHRPSDPGVSATLGWVYVRKGFPALGIPHLVDAVEAAPANPRWRYRLGLAYRQSGQASRASVEINRALAIDPGLADEIAAASTSLGPAFAQ